MSPRAERPIPVKAGPGKPPGLCFPRGCAVKRGGSRLGNWYTAGVSTPLAVLSSEIHACDRCPRLAQYLRKSREEHPDYWSRPVSGFGDPEARLFILGLAPAFHGGNRHGRIFTGDESGRWLWGALYELGAASDSNSTGREQPLSVRGVYISNAVRCAPPGNRPTGEEFDACREFLRQEMELLPEVRVVLALGKLAHDTYLKLRGEKLAAYPFHHGAAHDLRRGRPVLVDSYHPSRQNTNTGVLTWDMWTTVLENAAQAALMSAKGVRRTPSGQGVQMAKGTRARSQRRPVTVGPQQLQQMAEAWARQMFAPLPGARVPREGWPGRQTQAVIVQTEDRDHDSTAKALKRRLAQNTAVRKAIADAAELIEAGDMTAARSAIAALGEEDLPSVYWCDSVEELAPVLADCLQNSEQCHESGPIEGPAGRVIWMFVWYDPSHPVGLS
jgi:uracil-DNA glycosylase